MSQFKSSELESAFNNIMDTFSGGDNTAFVSFLFMLRELDRQALEGDGPAQKLINEVVKFSRFIDVSQKDFSKKADTQL
jgi:hypothetical protein